VVPDCAFDPIVKMPIASQRSNVNLDEPDQANDVRRQSLVVSQE
jgi:hypothetical protein